MTRQIDFLGEILRRHDLSEIEWREEGHRVITLRRQREVVAAAPQVMFAPPPAAAHRAAPPPAPSHAPATPAPKAETSDGNVSYITSPFVGTFYRSPSPDAPPFVEVGTRVRKGQVLCIVEAMKLMNEIEAEVDGTIVADPRRERPAGRVRRAALPDPQVADAPRVQEDPHRQPRRDRAARHPRLPRAGHRARSRSTRRPTPTRCTSSSPTRASASARRRRKQSYLHIPAIISAAEVTGADAIHPGYGFLSENAEFAEMCERCGLALHRPARPS